MSLSRAGRRLAGLRCAGALWRPAALLFCLSLGACSSTGTSMQSAAWYPALAAGPVAAVAPATGKRPVVEIEGDGLEGQLPPRRRVEDVPDDPSEPFSPNYGAVPSLDPSDAPEPA